jgi:sulfite dehydrogenase
MRRRDFIRFAGATAALSAAGCAGTGGAGKARVVVIGGGYGGATAAKYMRLWDPGIDVVMVERANIFTSCPISNLVLGGNASMDDIRRGYDGLRKYGVRVVHDEATAVDASKKVVRLQRGGDLPYDRLIVSPGIDFMFNEVEGYQASQARILHAWKAGEQTIALRRQLEAMKDGGVYVLSILPARAIRARLASGALFQAGQAALQGAAARRQPGRNVQGAAVQARLGRPLQGNHRVPE